MKNVTGLFDNYSTAKQVVTDLEAIGIPSDDISIVTHDANRETDAAGGATAGAGIGAMIGGAGGLLAGLGILAIPGVGPVVAAGWLAATAAGAAGGAVVGAATGGLIGALMNEGVSEEDAHLYAEGVRRGGTLVSAKVPDNKHAQAQQILTRASMVNVDDRRRRYTDEGWQRFDLDAKPYSVDEIESERLRYR